ncbi:MAG: septum formation initiator family protein [Clostridiales bacterium]|nr:septum formation initiator family protein [Clostridiales bacterium]
MASRTSGRDNISRTRSAGRDLRSKSGSVVRRTAEKTKHIKLNIKRLAVSAAVFVFCVYFICVTVGQQHTINAKQKEIDEINSQIVSANRETESLKSELESVNEPEYLERMAREKLGLVKPNERVYIDANSSK